MISQATSQGMLRRAIYTAKAVTTSANTTSGSINLCRVPNSFTVPSLGGSVTAAYFTYIRSFYSATNAFVLGGHETDLGTLTVSTNTFVAGSSMPTKTIEGSSIQTASIFPVLVATASLTATTPVVTITYTDQDGNTGNTCTMTLPTNPVVQTGFFMVPHLANGDTGVRAITNMSISTGSAGTLKVYGVIPQHLGVAGTIGTANSLDFLQAPFPLVPFAAGEVLAFYVNGTAANDLCIFLGAVGDN